VAVAVALAQVIILVVLEAVAELQYTYLLYLLQQDIHMQWEQQDRREALMEMVVQVEHHLLAQLVELLLVLQAVQVAQQIHLLADQGEQAQMEL
jgi:hypothetical protein